MKRIYYQILFILLLLICTALFFKEVSSGGIRFPHIDKVAHFGVFFILAALFKRAMTLPNWGYILVLAFYGAAVELIQGTLPHRFASFADFIADIAGILCYLACHAGWQQLRKRNHHE